MASFAALNGQKPRRYYFLAKMAVYACRWHSFPSSGKSVSRRGRFFFSSSARPSANASLVICSLLYLSAFYHSIDSCIFSYYFSRRFGAAAALFRSRHYFFFFLSFCYNSVFAALARTAFVIDLASIFLILLSFWSRLALFNCSLALLRCMCRTALVSE